MRFFQTLPPVGAAVIVVILLLFFLAAILLFLVTARYRSLQKQAADPRALPDGGFIAMVRADYVAAYRQYGKNTNTPAIINNAVCAKLGGMLFFERFMNSAVSLFVTLGLFGTFLGLSLSVTSLTELLSLSSTEEWLSILNSVGGGLLSSLSGMEVAFYTSLVGVGCSILFTILRTICNPQVEREKLETMVELWLDHVVAPKVKTDLQPDDDASVLLAVKDEMHAHAQTVETSLTAAAEQMERALTAAAQSLAQTVEYSKEPISAFYNTVSIFNDNVRDFSQFNYELRGNIERMDVIFRDLSGTIRALNTALEREGGRRQ